MILAAALIAACPLHTASAATPPQLPALSKLQHLSGEIKAGTTLIVASVEDAAGNIAAAITDRFAQAVASGNAVAYTAASTLPVSVMAPAPSTSLHTPAAPRSVVIEHTTVVNAPADTSAISARLNSLITTVGNLASLLPRFAAQSGPTGSSQYTPQQIAGNGSAYISAGNAPINQLANTAINNPTITGGSITAASIVGTIGNAISSALATIDDLTSKTITATNVTFTNATMTSLSVSGDTTLAGDLAVGGNFSAGSTSFAAASSTGVIAQNATTTNLVATNATSTNLFASVGSFGSLSGTAFSGLTSNYLPRWNGGTWMNSLVYDNGTDIGIGTTSPSTLLAIDSAATNGSILQLSNSSTGGHMWDLLSTGSSNTGGPGRLDIFDRTAGAARLSIAANGNMGVGTTSPSQALAVNGNGYFTGNLVLGNGNQNGGLTVNGGATTTGALVLTGNKTYAGASGTSNAWLVQSGALSGVGSSGNDGQISPLDFYITSDTVDTTTNGPGYLTDLSVRDNAQAGHSGGRTAIQGEINVAGTPTLVTGADYVGVLGMTRCAANLTGTSGAFANTKVIVLVVILMPLPIPGKAT